MLSSLALSVYLASIFLGVESISFKAPSQLPFIQHGDHQEVLEKDNGLVRAMGPAPPHIGKQIPQDERDTWNVDCTSVLTNHECGKVIDGSNNTFWQTKVDTQSIDPLPHAIIIDLREVKNVNAISVRPLPDADLGGAIAGHRVSLSVEPLDVDSSKWNVVAYGTWFEDVQGGNSLIYGSCHRKSTDYLCRQVRGIRTASSAVRAS